MRINIVLDDDLVKEAQELTGIKTKKELVHEALRTLIDSHKGRQVRTSGRQGGASLRESVAEYEQQEQPRRTVEVDAAALEELRSLVDKLTNGEHSVANDELVQRARQMTGIQSKVELVEEGLRALMAIEAGKRMRALRGKLKWEGDLNEMRENRFDYD